jgi:hypothetical protein
MTIEQGIRYTKGRSRPGTMILELRTAVFLKGLRQFRVWEDVRDEGESTGQELLCRSCPGLRVGRHPSWSRARLGTSQCLVHLPSPWFVCFIRMSTRMTIPLVRVLALYEALVPKASRSIHGWELLCLAQDEQGTRENGSSRSSTPASPVKNQITGTMVSRSDGSNPRTGSLAGDWSGASHFPIVSFLADLLRLVKASTLRLLLGSPYIQHHLRPPPSAEPGRRMATILIGVWSVLALGQGS